MTIERLREACRRALPAFLPRQRWFGGKARLIQAVDLRDALRLTPADADPVFLVIVAVRYADRAEAGEGEDHAMVLGARADPGALPVVAPAEGGTTLVEMTADPRAVGGLWAGLDTPGHAVGRDRPMLLGGRLRLADVTPRALRLLGASVAPRVRPVGAEQSNTSVRLSAESGALVFKLFRRLEAGEHPELEMGRFLARTSFRATPLLEGSLTWLPGRGEPAAVGVLQQWIENRGDGWTAFVTGLRHATTAEGLARLEGGARALGTTTADLHLALASSDRPAFAPEAVTAADARAWRAATQTRATRLWDVLAREGPRWDAPARAAAAAIGQRCPDPAALVTAPDPAAGAAFHRIRVHGDYHLGQTLETAEGFVVIDFEGEPARSLDERRAKACALKDVAGMLRSFDYAVEAARADAGVESGDAGNAGQVLARLRGAFLDAYLARARGATFLPPDDAALRAWLTFFELDKALYELEYEANNRPAWLPIPLRGLLRLVAR